MPALWLMLSDLSFTFNGGCSIFFRENWQMNHFRGRMNKEQVLTILKSHQTELQALGIEHLSLFGSVARGEETAESDVDLAAQFQKSARVGLFKFAEIEQKLMDILECPVDLVAEPASKPRIQLQIERDRVNAF